MTAEEKTALAKALVALEINRAEIRMLSAIVTGLCQSMPSETKAKARDLIARYAELEPKFVVGQEAEDRARLGITQLASSWIATLTP